MDTIVLSAFAVLFIILAVFSVLMGRKQGRENPEEPAWHQCPFLWLCSFVSGILVFCFYVLAVVLISNLVMTGSSKTAAELFPRLAAYYLRVVEGQEGGLIPVFFAGLIVCLITSLVLEVYNIMTGNKKRP